MQAGGEQGTRSPKLAEPGPIASKHGPRWKPKPKTNKTYAGIVKDISGKSKKARKRSGKSKTKKYNLLQREQLAAWLAAVRQISNPVVSAYLQALLPTGARREELPALKWEDVNIHWKNIKLNDKTEDFRKILLTPYQGENKIRILLPGNESMTPLRIR